jgi:hypothetical protein
MSKRDIIRLSCPTCGKESGYYSQVSLLPTPWEEAPVTRVPEHPCRVTGRVKTSGDDRRIQVEVRCTRCGQSWWSRSDTAFAVLRSIRTRYSKNDWKKRPLLWWAKDRKHIEECSGIEIPEPSFVIERRSLRSAVSALRRALADHGEVFRVEKKWSIALARPTQLTVQCAIVLLHPNARDSGLLQPHNPPRSGTMIGFFEPLDVFAFVNYAHKETRIPYSSCVKACTGALIDIPESGFICSTIGVRQGLHTGAFAYRLKSLANRESGVLVRFL